LYEALRQHPYLKIYPTIAFNIAIKESSSDLKTGAEPHRLELEEEFWWRRAPTGAQVGTLYPLLNPFFSLRKNRDFR